MSDDADMAKIKLERAAQNDFIKLEVSLNAAPKEFKKVYGYLYFSVATEGANLINNFTAAQASENIRLYVLCILTSTGKYYKRSYPDQEFGPYISLFSILFSREKTTDVAVGSIWYSAYHNYNYNISSITMSEDRTDLPKEVKAKEKKHKSMVDAFVEIFKENDAFNFGQIVALGLIANINPMARDTVIAGAKILMQYEFYFTQLLRVALSTPILGGENDLKELKARAGTIEHLIVGLISTVVHEGKEYTVHSLVTKAGNRPENLAVFASCFARSVDITYDNIRIFVDKLDHLDQDLLKALITSYASTSLPYKEGKIVYDHPFPVVSMNTLENEEEIREIIERAKPARISNERATRFNEIRTGARTTGIVNLSELELKHHITLPSAVKNRRFKDLKKDILEDQNFVLNQLLGNNSGTLDTVAFTSDFVYLMLKSILNRSETRRITDLVFDREKALRDQISDIEYKANIIVELLARCDEALLDALAREPRMPQDALSKTLIFLQKLEDTVLESMGYTLATVLLGASQEFIIKHFDSFRIATEFYFSAQPGLELRKVYSLAEKIATGGGSFASLKKILSYCADNKDYSVITLLSDLDCRLDHMDLIVDWITSLSIRDVRTLGESSNVEFARLLKINSIEKIKVVASIILKFGDKISKEQYGQIFTHIVRHDIYYAKLLKSYLFAPDTSSMPTESRIKFVLSTLDQLERAQVVFSENNLKRFEYDRSDLITKITKIKRKNTDNEQGYNLFSIEQTELFKCAISVYERARYYKDLTTNEMREKALHLKRERALLKENSLPEKRQLDLEYLALNMELMYRETAMFPWNTQLLSVLNVVIHGHMHVIQRIDTAQGKSLTSALLASYFHFIEHTVDITSSYNYLAKRDLKKFSSFYDSLGIAHASNPIDPTSDVHEYKEGGVNLGTPSNLALFLAITYFHDHTRQLWHNSKRSVISDEGDDVMTYPINSILAVPLMRTTQEESRTLFEHVLYFVGTESFKNEKVSRQSDVENFILYIDYVFKRYDSSYSHKLTPMQLRDLQADTRPEAKKLYLLYKAINKCPNFEDMVDKFLDAALLAGTLREGIDYALLKEDMTDDKLWSAVPLTKKQPSKGAQFGNAVQPFLHLLIERQYPNYKGRFDIFAPADTIFNISPTSYFYSYRFTGGIIVAMSGTVGGAEEREEFRLVYHTLAFSIPPFEPDIKTITRFEVEDQDAQYAKMFEVLNMTQGRPVIIFCDDAQEAERVLNRLTSEITHNATIGFHLRAASFNDTGTTEEIVAVAGNDNQFTVTTGMLERGVDFQTKNKGGFVVIGLREDVTQSSLEQSAGRSGRRGQPGDVVLIFNKQLYKGSIDEHIKAKSHKEALQRSRHRSLSAVMQYFNQCNLGKVSSMVRCNDFLSKTWAKLLKENDQAPIESKKSLLALRGKLVEAAKKEYPVITKKIDAYLKQIDAPPPAKIDEEFGNNPMLPEFADAIVPYPANRRCDSQNWQDLQTRLVEGDLKSLALIPEFTPTASSLLSISHVVQRVPATSKIRRLGTSSDLDRNARAHPISRFDIP